jgi:hypothetical protein
MSTLAKQEAQATIQLLSAELVKAYVVIACTGKAAFLWPLLLLSELEEVIRDARIWLLHRTMRLMGDECASAASPVYTGSISAL